MRWCCGAVMRLGCYRVIMLLILPCLILADRSFLNNASSVAMRLKTCCGAGTRVGYSNSRR